VDGSTLLSKNKNGYKAHWVYNVTNKLSLTENECGFDVNAVEIRPAFLLLGQRAGSKARSG
jgi:hypothetical protein